MKRFLVLFVFFTFSGLVAQAQGFAFGLKGGVSSSKVDIRDPQGSIARFKEGDNITGYHAGLFTRFNLLGFMVQPEAVFSTSGGKLTLDNGQGGSTVEKIGFTHLDIPVLVGYKLAFLRAYAGPVASLLLQSDLEEKSIKQHMESSEWGYQVGAGLDISRLTADVRFERLKRSYADNPSGAGDFRNEQVIFSLGYKLFGK